MKKKEIEEMPVRKTELWFGIIGGAVGILVAALTLAEVLPYAQQQDKLYALICMGAGAAGITGALFVPRHHVAGSVIMAIGLVVIIIFGFPWQSVSAVLMIISATLSLAPVREPSN
jgi:hypothetical protein